MTQRAKIDYPTRWTYKIIGKSQANIERAVEKVLGPQEHELKPSQKSSKGTFISMDLSLTVKSDDERTSIFHKIYGEEGIKMVL